MPIERTVDVENIQKYGVRLCHSWLLNVYDIYLISMNHLHLGFQNRPDYALFKVPLAKSRPPQGQKQLLVRLPRMLDLH
jgi:hypothetical protein